MSKASPIMQDLARQLLLLEEAHGNSSTAEADTALQVIEQLRLHLVRFAGVNGFRSLLARSLTLAKAEDPSLEDARVRDDGSLEGFQGIKLSPETDGVAHAGLILVAHLLQLLVTFIGESLTLGLLREKWPEASIDRANLGSGEKQ